MVDLASLVVRLVADTSRYRRGLDNAADDLRRFAANARVNVAKVATAAAGAALAAAAGFAVLAKQAIDAADSMNDLSKATGISTESLSQLKFAAEQSGTDLDGLATGLRKLAKQAVEAAGGSKEAAASFKLIGVSVTDSAGKLKGTEQLLLDVAEQFAQYKDGAAKAAAAQELFGKSGTALIPFLNNGRAGIEALKAEADKLGLTLKGTTAQAADEFNDNLNKLKQQLGGIGLQIAERFLPALVDITKSLSDLIAKKSDVRGFLDALVTGFRTVAYLAVATADAFDDVGKLIGGFAAYVAQVAKGNFAEAAAIDEEFKKDALAREEATNKALARIWGERADTYTKTLGPKRLGSYLSVAQQEANKNRTGLESPLKDFPVEIATATRDELQEVDITLEKVKIPEDFYRDLHDETQTALERAFADLNRKRSALDFLRLEGQIDVDTYNARLKEIQTETLAALSQGPKEAKEEVEKLNEYQIQAARNTQDIIANTFESLATGADVSAKSILQSFGQMIVQLAAQAAAANIAGKLFGEAATGVKGSGGGLVSAALGLLSRDSGGRGQRGRAYMIGRGAQPELFVPDTSGTFIPAGAAGGMQVTNNFNFSGDAPLSRRTQLQVAAAASRGVERASRRNN